MISANSVQHVSPKSNRALSVSLVPVEQVHHLLEQNAGKVMGIVSYGIGNIDRKNTAVPCLNVQLNQLGNSDYVEMWNSSAAVEIGEDASIKYSKNGALLFACIDIPCAPDIQQQSKELYLKLFHFLKKHDYKHVLRVWNHFPRINEYDGELERYQEFCVGRHQAFSEFYGEDFHGRLPAASAIGTSADRFSLYLIASKSPGLNLENPRQISAYSYPEQYGPCSPSFARATVYRGEGVNKLFLSGTASIVGHETVHKDQVERQLSETLNNIEHILRHDSLQSQPIEANTFKFIKVYLRQREYLPMVKSRVQQFFRAESNILYLHGDICRRDLLLEIEGISEL